MMLKFAVVLCVAFRVLAESETDTTGQQPLNTMETVAMVREAFDAFKNWSSFIKTEMWIENTEFYIGIDKEYDLLAEQLTPEFEKLENFTDCIESLDRVESLANAIYENASLCVDLESKMYVIEDGLQILEKIWKTIKKLEEQYNGCPVTDSVTLSSNGMLPCFIEVNRQIDRNTDKFFTHYVQKDKIYENIHNTFKPHLHGECAPKFRHEFSAVRRELVDSLVNAKECLKRKSTEDIEAETSETNLTAGNVIISNVSSTDFVSNITITELPQFSLHHEIDDTVSRVWDDITAFRNNTKKIIGNFVIQSLELSKEIRRNVSNLNQTLDSHVQRLVDEANSTDISESVDILNVTHWSNSADDIRLATDYCTAQVLSFGFWKIRNPRRYLDDIFNDVVAVKEGISTCNHTKAAEMNSEESRQCVLEIADIIRSRVNTFDKTWTRMEKRYRRVVNEFELDLKDCKTDYSENLERLESASMDAAERALKNVSEKKNV